MKQDGDDKNRSLEWMRGKTYATLCFVSDARRYLLEHPSEPQRDRLERFVERLRQGQHALQEPLPLGLFLEGLTHSQYLETQNLLQTLSLQDPRVPELHRRVRHYQAVSRRYQIVCTTACYVGQGLCFEYGHVLETYYERSEAEQKLDDVNADPWCLACWELRELEPMCSSSRGPAGSES